MSRLALALTFVFTASPLAAQGPYVGPVLVWDNLHYGEYWGAALGGTFQGLERDADRRIDVRFVACCGVPMLQMSVLYAKMFNVDAWAAFASRGVQKPVQSRLRGNAANPSCRTNLGRVNAPVRT